MNHGAKRRRLRDPERQNVLRVGVDDRMDIGPRFVDGGVYESFEIERTLFVPHRLSVEAQFDDVVAFDQLGCERAGEEKVLRIVGIANADMAVGVHHVLSREDAIGDD